MNGSKRFFPLSAMSVGETAEVLHLRPENGRVDRLRALGFREGCSLRMISNDRSNFVVGLDGARFGVADDLAALVLMQSPRR